MMTGIFRGKRRGVTLVELLTAIPISLVILTAVLQVMFLSVRTFEKNEDLATASGWDSSEKLFALLGAAVRQCGVGLPPQWDSLLFSRQVHLDYVPAWALWKRSVTVGNSARGNSFVSVGGDWGNTLRIVYGTPIDAILMEDARLKASESSAIRFSDNLGISGSLGVKKTGSWLLFPGTSVPVQIVGEAASSSPVLRAQRDAAIPWGTPVCRLMAVLMYASEGTLFANFHDDSGLQPLARNVERVSFRLKSGGRVLHVKVTASVNSGREIQESRSWKIGL